MPQSVILLTDVPGLGEVGDVKTVKDGYAQNYLLPNHLALITTTDAIRKFEKQKERILKEKDRLMSKAKDLAEKIAKIGLAFEKPMGQGGRLFGSVSPLDIAEELSRQGITVEKKSILLQGPFKTPGDHMVRVRIHSQVVVDVPVKIIGIKTEQYKGEGMEEAEPEEKK